MTIYTSTLLAGYPLVITATCDEHNGVRMVRGNRFWSSNNFYEDPVRSMDMGIILASDLSETSYEQHASLYRYRQHQ